MGPVFIAVYISYISCRLILISVNFLIMVCILVFTVLHVMQTRYSDENSVCPSVRLSVTRVIPEKTEERSVQICIPYERTFILVF